MCRAWGSSSGRVAAGSVFQGAEDGLDGRERQFGAGAPAVREVDDDEIGLGIDQQPRAGRAAVLERASRGGKVAAEPGQPPAEAVVRVARRRALLAEARRL